MNNVKGRFYRLTAPKGCDLLAAAQIQADSHIQYILDILSVYTYTYTDQIFSSYCCPDI